MDVTAAPSLIPELEAVIQHGSAATRAEALRRITTLFLEMAPASTTTISGLFDDVFGSLIDEIEGKARAELSQPARAGEQFAARKSCAGSPATTTSRSPARCWRNRRGLPKPTLSTSRTR